MWIERFNEQPAGLYVHIPFCQSKCLYCDFPSSAGCENMFDDYVAALCEEICNSPYRGRFADTIFYGGGTPSLLRAEALGEIMACLESTFRLAENAEITLEANPGTIDRKKAECWRSAGFNRVSVGVQSFDDALLKACGRIHDGATAVAGIQILRDAGFETISIDLMSGLPGGSREKLLKDVALVANLAASHVSLYTLKLEEGTALEREVKRGRIILPDEDEEAEMFDAAVFALQERGYERYEISNYSLPGERCCHNLKYWKYQPYLGFGAAAASFADGTRWSNVRDVDAYMKAMRNGSGTVAEKQQLSHREAMSEYAFLGLRVADGIDSGAFAMIFGVAFEDEFDVAIEKCLQCGWLEKTAQGFRMSGQGVNFGNRVFAEFAVF